MNGGTSIVPDLDSIAEFRVLTNNFDAEYGNYSGGIVNVVTKSGTNGLHGSAFEFLRNTALDAKNYFSSERAKFNQNQFGGTVGGPIAKNKIFFFGDYQGTRTREGVDTGLISVPSSQERGIGQFNGDANLISIAQPSRNAAAGVFTTTEPSNGQQVVVPTTVSGQNLANQLGSGVSAGEPYYFYAGEHEAGNPSLIY